MDDTFVMLSAWRRSPTHATVPERWKRDDDSDEDIVYYDDYDGDTGDEDNVDVDGYYLFHLDQCRMGLAYSDAAVSITVTRLIQISSMCSFIFLTLIFVLI